MASSDTAGTAVRVRRTGTVLAGYFRRLLTPPLPGDGLLLVGLLEGVLGWGGSALLLRNPGLAPLGLVASIVALWVLLTAGIVVVGVVYTAPTVRRNRVWLVWGGLNVAATLVNVAAVADLLPAGLVPYAYYHPWLAVLGVGYLATAVDDLDSPQVRRQERAVYALGGAASLAVLALAVLDPPGWLLASPFLVGAALHLMPIAHDVLADAVLIARP